MNENRKEISKFEVYTIIKSRLATQDRCPKISTYKKQKTKFHFLPKLYDKSLYCNYERSYSNELVSRQIMKLKVFYKVSETVIMSTTFKEIENFSIDTCSHQLYFTIAGDEKQAYTPINKKHEGDGNKIDSYEPFILEDHTFAKATIDHNPTFISFIESNKANLATMIQISEFLNKQHKSKFSKDNRDYIAGYIEKEDLKDKLWKELEFIADNQVLELVHAKHNTRSDE